MKTNKQTNKQEILILYLMAWLVFSFSVSISKKTDSMETQQNPANWSIHTTVPGSLDAGFQTRYFRERNISVIIECFLLFFPEKVSNDRSASKCIVCFPPCPFQRQNPCKTSKIPCKLEEKARIGLEESAGYQSLSSETSLWDKGYYKNLLSGEVYSLFLILSGLSF